MYGGTLRSSAKRLRSTRSFSNSVSSQVISPACDTFAGATCIGFVSVIGFRSFSRARPSEVVSSTLNRAASCFT